MRVKIIMRLFGRREPEPIKKIVYPKRDWRGRDKEMTYAGIGGYKGRRKRTEPIKKKKTTHPPMNK
jgi:hypothetical protein